MSKTKKLVVTRSTRVADITDLIPGDHITRDGVKGIITDVRGTIKDGVLHYVFTITGYTIKMEFLFKLYKV